MQKLKFLVLLSAVFMVTGCATYKAQVVSTDRVESYKYKAEKDGLKVAVEPYDQSDKTKAAFYVDVTSKNVRPVQLVIENTSVDNFLITRNDIRLLDKSGNEIKPVNSNFVYGLFEKNELAYAFWGFGIFSYMSAEKANEKMQSDWHEKEFPEDRTILPSRKAAGFVFFQTPEHLEGKILKINLINLKNNQTSELEVSLS